MAVTTAIAAVAGTAYSVYAGEQAKKQQSQALAQQQQGMEQQAQAQRRAEAGATAQQTLGAQETARANKKTPDVGAIMAGAQQAAQGAGAGTMLTGPGGVAANAMQLGKSTLLGA